MDMIGCKFTVCCADGVDRENVKIYADKKACLTFEMEDGTILCGDCAVTKVCGGTFFVPPVMADYFLAKHREDQK